MPVRLRKDQRISLLRGVDLLAGCTNDQLRQIASLSTEIDAASGQVLAEQGRQGREFFIIVEGTATASRNGAVRPLSLPPISSGNLPFWTGASAPPPSSPRQTCVCSSSPALSSTSCARSYPSVAQRMLVVMGPGSGTPMRCSAPRTETIPSPVSPSSQGCNGSPARFVVEGKYVRQAFCPTDLRVDARTPGSAVAPTAHREVPGTSPGASLCFRARVPGPACMPRGLRTRPQIASPLLWLRCGRVRGGAPSRE